MNLHDLDRAHICWCHPVELGHSFVTTIDMGDAAASPLPRTCQQLKVVFIHPQRERADGDTGVRRFAHLADQSSEKRAIRTFHCD